MLAMQYSFPLPADYDMSIIRARIENKGHLMDGFPLLKLKAYLHANRDQNYQFVHENLYAPFYLWDNPDGMNSFLASNGFTGLVSSFGWPSIKIWSVWASEFQPTLEGTLYATREIIQIQPHTRLADLQKAETERVRTDVDNNGAMGAVVGFEPVTWTLMRFRLWAQYREDFDREAIQVYTVGHLSTYAVQGEQK